MFHSASLFSLHYSSTHRTPEPLDTEELIAKYLLYSLTPVVCIAPHNPVLSFTGLGRVIYRFVCQCARAGGARRAGAAIANNILISHCLDQSLLRGQHQIIGSPGPSARPHTNNNFYTFLVFFSVLWRSFNLNLRQ